MAFSVYIDDSIVPRRAPARLPVGRRLAKTSAARARRGKRNAMPVRISLALQGGGAFGAFTWGVLDELLADGDIGFDAVSGASAGAMNAVLLASGLARGGPAEARAGLERFWHKVSNVAEKTRHNPFVPTGNALAAITHTISPYQFNPLDLNPLRDILASEVDFDAVQKRTPARLLIGTTRIRDGALRIFRNKDITSDVVLASSCLPHLHHAVKIDGEPHWDGGFAANPPLMQLVSASKVSEILVVQIIPTIHTELPKTSLDIDKRIGQIAFSSSLHKDLDALSTMTKLSRAEGGNSKSPFGRKLQRLHLHHLAAEDHVEGLSGISIMNTEWNFLTHLRDQGRAAAQNWKQKLLQESKLVALA
jgi:NTE family protein